MELAAASVQRSKRADMKALNGAVQSHFAVAETARSRVSRAFSVRREADLSYPFPGPLWPPETASRPHPSAGVGAFHDRGGFGQIVQSTTIMEPGPGWRPARRDAGHARAPDRRVTGPGMAAYYTADARATSPGG